MYSSRFAFLLLPIRAWLFPAREEIKGKIKQTINTLAVLPFANLSNDPDNEFFSDGVTEELLNALILHMSEDFELLPVLPPLH